MDGFKLFDDVDLGAEGMASDEAVILDPIEVVASAEAMEDVLAIESEFKAGNTTIAMAEKLGENLEAQVAVESAILVAPESVTSDLVQMAIENFNQTAAFITGDTAMTLGTEEISANPVEALTLAIEEKENMGKKIIANVKLMYKKFLTMLKKLYAKVVVAMDGSAKKAKALKEALGKMSGGDVIKMDDKAKKALFGKVGYAVNELGKGKFDGSFGKAFADKIGGGKSPINAISAVMIKVNSTAAAFEVKDDAEVSGKDVNTAIDDISKDSLFVAYSGGDVKLFKAKLPEVKDDAKLTGKKAAAMVGGITATVQKESLKLDDFKPSDVKVSDLVAVVDAMIKPAEGVKAFVKSVETDVDKLSGTAAKDGGASAKIFNVVISSVALDVILGYVKGVSAVLGAAASLSGKGSKEDKKEDKKEEEKEEEK